MQSLCNSDYSVSKIDLLQLFRDESRKLISTLASNHKNDAKEITSNYNKQFLSLRDLWTSQYTEQAKKSGIGDATLINSVYMIYYCSLVVLLEIRNEVWPYEYMAFSRRIGELWDPFCQLCFKNIPDKIKIVEPPSFNDVKSKLKNNFNHTIDNFGITSAEKQYILEHYETIWSMVSDINLSLDLHFKKNSLQYNIDFKSGFGSNEKGNTHRLLMVASVYKHLGNNNCVLIVRANEDQNNHYFRTLKNSTIWEAYCGAEAYSKIKEYTNFDLKTWIDTNINWQEDLSSTMVKHLKDNDLIKYLSW